MKDETNGPSSTVLSNSKKKLYLYFTYRQKCAKEKMYVVL